VNKHTLVALDNRIIVSIVEAARGALAKAKTRQEIEEAIDEVRHAIQTAERAARIARARDANIDLAIVETLRREARESATRPVVIAGVIDHLTAMGEPVDEAAVLRTLADLRKGF